MKKGFLGLLVLSSAFSSAVFANMGPKGFGRYMNHYFIETGTQGGDSIQKALNCNFTEIRSIEIDQGHFDYATARFKDLDNVKIYKGSTTEMLSVVLEEIDKPATFWLDAHVAPAYTDGRQNCPVLEELDQIKEHHIKTHTILIDDMHCCNNIEFDYLSREDIKAKIWEINPDYEITFTEGGEDGEYPDNVMVAQIKQ